MTFLRAPAKRNRAAGEGFPHPRGVSPIHGRLGDVRHAAPGPHHRAWACRLPRAELPFATPFTLPGCIEMLPSHAISRELGRRRCTGGPWRAERSLPSRQGTEIQTRQRFSILAAFSRGLGESVHGHGIPVGETSTALFREGRGESEAASTLCPHEVGVRERPPPRTCFRAHSIAVTVEALRHRALSGDGSPLARTPISEAVTIRRNTSRHPRSWYPSKPPGHGVDSPVGVRVLRVCSGRRAARSITEPERSRAITRLPGGSPPEEAIHGTVLGRSLQQGSQFTEVKSHL